MECGPILVMFITIYHASGGHSVLLALVTTRVHHSQKNKKKCHFTAPYYWRWVNWAKTELGENRIGRKRNLPKTTWRKKFHLI